MQHADEHPVHRLDVEGALERFVRLPYALPPDVLDRAVKALAAAADDVMQSPPRATYGATIA